MPRAAAELARLEQKLKETTELFNELLRENYVLKQRELALQAHVVALSQASTPWRDAYNHDALENDQICHYEGRIRAALVQVGCHYENSPVQTVLSRLHEQPHRVAEVCSMSFAERVAAFRTAITQLGVLLPKLQHCADGQWAQDFQHHVDSIIELQLLMSFWDGSHNTVFRLVDVNLETMEPQKCPAELVIAATQAIQLNAAQKAMLKAQWERCKACKAALMTEYDEASAALLRLQQLRQSEQQQFMQQAEQLPTRPAPRWLMEARECSSSHSSSHSGDSTGSTEGSSDEGCSSGRGGTNPNDSRQSHQHHKSSGLAAVDLGCSGKEQAQCSMLTGSPRALGSTVHAAATSSSSLHKLSPNAAAAELADTVQLVPSTDEQKLEQRLDNVVERLMFLSGTHGCLLFNTLTTYQIATGMVMHYPWLPTSLRLLEAWEQSGWQ